MRVNEYWVSLIRLVDSVVIEYIKNIWKKVQKKRTFQVET
jgi:hypothetical protein